jgi:hypothetical protein
MYLLGITPWWEEHTVQKILFIAGMVAVLANCVVVDAAEPVFVAERPAEIAATIGFGGMLVTVPYMPTTSAGYADFNAELHKAFTALHEGGVAVVVEIVPGVAPQPLGRIRPYLDHKGIMQGGGGDQTWLPEFDDDFVAFTSAIAGEYGRPQGPVVALTLGGIERADLPRRAELAQLVVQAVEGTEVEVRRVERQFVDVVATLPVRVALNRAVGSSDLVRVYGLDDGADADRALVAAQRFVGGRDFSRLIFAHGVPWVFAFAGLAGDEEDGSLVLVGDMDAVAPGRASSRGIALDGARMRIVAGPYRLYDAMGVSMPMTDGEWPVPLDGRGFYLRGDGTEGSFAALVTAVRAAQIEGVEPLSVVARDMTEAVDRGAVLKLMVGNVLNRPIEGVLKVELGELVVDAPARLRLAPHERQLIEVKIVGGEAVAKNNYRLRVEFDAGADGVAVHEEVMRVNLIGRQTIKVDGKLGDWTEALPQSLGRGVTGWLAYDDTYLYVAAKVRDRIEDPGTLRFADRDDDTFFYPQVSHELDLSQALFKVDRVHKRSANPAHLWRPDGTGRIDGRWENSTETQAFAIDLTIPDGKPRQVALYIPPGEFDPAGMDIELYDRKRQMSLGRDRLENLGKGVYAVYRLAGKVRIILRVHDWHYRARLAGIFFDPADEASGFVGFDRETSGEWFDRYGAEGFYVVGAERIDPPDISLRVPKVIKKVRREWPEGVRRFSYRREPVLPSGDSPGFDNVQIAFNAVPMDTAPVELTDYACSDYEYALNKVSKRYGGGTEVWRLLAPGMKRGDFYPRDDAGFGQGVVDGAKLSMQYKNKMRISEVAIPWQEIPAVRALMEAGEPVKFSLRVNYGQVESRELARGRSASRLNEPAFHAIGQPHWANELEFGWQRD